MKGGNYRTVPYLTERSVQKRRGVGAVRVKDRGTKLAAGEFEDEEFGIIPRQLATGWEQEEDEQEEEGGIFI